MINKIVDKISRIAAYTGLLFYEKIRIVSYFFVKPDLFLIGTPLHGNLGDHAIAISERKWLADHFKNRVCLEIPGITYSRNQKLCKKLICKWGHADIFITGGGFLGTLWPEEEERVLDIINTFFQRNIIIFPQTLYYDLTSTEGYNSCQKACRAYKTCENLLLALRENASMEFAAKYFTNVRKAFVPDMALYLSQQSFRVKREGILFCLRRDKERVVKETEIRIIERIIKELWPEQGIKRVDTVLNTYLSTSSRKNEVEKKLRQFAASRLVITDRLHGMLFAVITGTPCLVLHSRSWKVKGVYEYIKQNEYVQYVEDIEEIDKILSKLDVEKEYLYQTDEIQGYYKMFYEDVKALVKY